MEVGGDAVDGLAHAAPEGVEPPDATVEAERASEETQSQPDADEAATFEEDMHAASQASVDHAEPGVERTEALAHTEHRIAVEATHETELAHEAGSGAQSEEQHEDTRELHNETGDAARANPAGPDQSQAVHDDHHDRRDTAPDAGELADDETESRSA